MINKKIGLAGIDPLALMYIDIETVSQQPNFTDLDESERSFWASKSKFIDKEDEGPEACYPKAAIYAEFGKIVCISIGFINDEGGKREFRLNSYFSDDEPELLKAFAEFCNQGMGAYVFAGHNIIEFDIPYICRRMLLNGLTLPKMLSQLSGQKSWAIPHVDTMELWKFGDYKNYTSLKLLTHIFGIPSPKEDIDGSQVGAVYWKEKDLPRIVRYCERDVWATAQLVLKLRGQNLIPESAVRFTQGKV